MNNAKAIEETNGNTVELNISATRSIRGENKEAKKSRIPLIKEGKYVTDFNDTF